MSIRPVASLVIVLAFVAPSLGAVPEGFVEETVATGFDQPVGVAFGPGDRMYVWEKIGRVWIVEDGERQFPPLLDIRDEVNEFWTRGMTGLALDPDFETNYHIYVMYTVDWEWYVTGGDPDPSRLDTPHDTFGRLVRFTCDPADDCRSIIPDSRWEMIGDSHDNGFAVTFASHTQNTIVFAPDGTMLLSAGDAASMLEVDTGGPRQSCCSSNTAEEDGILREKEQIGAFRSQLVDTHSGKILRIDPATAEGLPSNPWYDAKAPSAPRSRVWSLGYRNPYSFAVMPGTGSTDAADGDPGVLAIGDVGWDAWECLCINTEAGQNFGWPKYEGLVTASSYPGRAVPNLDAPNPLFDGVTCTQEFLFFNDLLVQDTLGEPSWPNPCDPSQQIPADLTFMHARPVMAWRNDRIFTSPLTMVPLFIGDSAVALPIDHELSDVEGFHMKGRATVGGAFYTGDKFPAQYRNSLFYAEAGSPPTTGGWIHQAVFDETTHALVRIVEFRGTGSPIFPTALATDPEGYGIYFANHLASGTGSIMRIASDCNGNGVGDDLDIEDGTSDDDNGNGIPDECDLPGDVDGDGIVDTSDLVLLLGAWGDCPAPPDPCPADVNDDGTVDTADLVMLIASWS
jgi:glucose/arabinose dehydrogenase